MAEIDPLLKRGEIAERFGVTAPTVSRWFREGKLTSVKTLGGHRRAKESEVRALIAKVLQRRTT